MNMFILANCRTFVMGDQYVLCMALSLSICIYIYIYIYIHVYIYIYIYIWWFPKIGVPQNRRFIRENPVSMDDLGVPLFLETPHIYIYDINIYI